jgi:hypothetical protein
MTMRAAPEYLRRFSAASLIGVAVAVAVTTAAVIAPPAAAQAVARASVPRAPRADSTVIYRREVFHYARSSRADPFRSLLGTSEVGMRVEDLALRGVVFHPDPARSVAVLAREGSPRLLRAHVGDRVGGIRIVSIRPNSIDVVVEELGVARRETIRITKATPKGTTP